MSVEQWIVAAFKFSIALIAAWLHLQQGRIRLRLPWQRNDDETAD